MVKYFSFESHIMPGNITVTNKNKTVDEINTYAEKNNLKIVQISMCNDDGIFVVFKKKN